jgi:6-pyruvoyltetrahydropterin/6-carboxytetrahydropterin synthase
MYTVCVQAHYDAAHFLRRYHGKCERLHGHRYVVEAALQAEQLDEGGMAFDFTELKQALRALANELDHNNLNELAQFQEIETSAENQARWFFDQLAARLPPTHVSGLLYVRVWETPTQWAEYAPTGVRSPARPPR